MAGHGSTVPAISLSLVALIASAIFLFALDRDMRPLIRAAHLAPTEQAITTAPRDAAAQPPAARAEAAPAGPADRRLAEIERRFEQAVLMLHAGRYEEAVVALETVIALSPRLSEAYVNLGYALLGLERYEHARNFFLAATDLKPFQHNAYWGLAVALEALNDLEGALGAMRTYLHLTPPDDPFVRRARSAIWEWDTRLARGPLPEHEAEWIETRTREWVERNLPQRDAPGAGDGLEIPVRGAP